MTGGGERGPAGRRRPGGADLHIHSHHSDGRASPGEIVAHAARLGLEAIAITDHDNCNAHRELGRTPDGAAVQVVPAIEFTTHWPGLETGGWGADVDVLGYFVDIDAPRFRAVEAAALDDIHERIAAVCALLAGAGADLSFDEVRAASPRYCGAAQVVRSMLEKGRAATRADAYAEFVRHWRRVRPSRWSIDAIIETVRRAGGAAVLAHPGGIRRDGAPVGASDLAGLVEMGLAGVEVHHPDHDPPVRSRLLGLARRFDLAVTGGSDDHGWPSGFPRMGPGPLTAAVVASLRARAQGA